MRIHGFSTMGFLALPILLVNCVLFGKQSEHVLLWDVHVSTTAHDGHHIFKIVVA